MHKTHTIFIAVGSFCLLAGLILLGKQSSAVAQPEGSETTNTYLPFIICEDCGTDDSSTTDCPDGDFIEVTADPANSAYPDPELSVTCTEDTVTVISNGIPNFEFVQVNPAGLEAQDYEWEFPLEPTWTDTPSDIPLLGTVAIAVNGIPIFGPNEAPLHNYGDPYLDGLLDYCNGHPGGNNDYHLHTRPDCLFTDTAGTPYLVLGYALDGYPILSPTVCTDDSCASTYLVESSWQEVGDGYQTGDNAWEAHEYVADSGDLDECNGMTLSDGSYAYFATDSFPYFLGCYHGEANVSTMP